MTKLLYLLSLLCLGCAPTPQQAPAIDPAPVEAVRPAGPFLVGVVEGPTLSGGVPSRVYFPAAAGARPSRPPSFSPAHEAALARRFGHGVAGALTRAVTMAIADAPEAEGRFPLIVFQPGASMAATDYRLLIEDLTSRGYVVLALNPETSPAVTGDRYQAAARELVEAVALARSGHPTLAHADVSRPVLLGHSLGGAAGVMALKDVAGAIAVNLDGDFNGRVRIPENSPVLALIGQTAGEAARSRTRRANVWRDSSTAAADAVILQIVDLKHFDFADVAMLQRDIPEDRRLTRFGAIGGPGAHALTVDLIAAFLDSRLNGDRGAWAAALAAHPQAAPPTTW